MCLGAIEPSYFELNHLLAVMFFIENTLLDYSSV